jgi:hypothetical protein
MSWREWLNVVLTLFVLVLAAAYLWARRHERREREAADRRREQRLTEWRLVEWPETPQTFPVPGATRLDDHLTDRLSHGDEFEELRHFFLGYFHQDWVPFTRTRTA